MSNVIDQKVVEMRFDNRHFEQNVSTTMSTLDKLKQSLKLPDASNSLKNVSAAAKSVDMNGLASGVETVRARFSALEVMGVTALANITNSAVNAGKRMISALTIDPIKTGFQEYETQINAVQTILANTESKGTTIDHVNEALETLNAYADKTIYNFTEMTRNIGTFTAAGVDLETSVNAIQGIANLAAVSGSNSQQASTAMYQLSQALASGTVKLMDWNSVVNAGMGGQVFQDAIKETARVHGVAIDEMIESEGSFRDTLSSGWLTAEILTETLSKFTMATEGATEAEIKANREKLKSLGYTDEQIEGIFKLGNTATNAATKVKTFTQLWDVMKESAQSGWAQTWKLLVGDFEEAKNLLTPLADFFTVAINKMSEARNELLESALGRGFSAMFDGLNDVLTKTTDGINSVLEPVKSVSGALEDLNAISNEVISGAFGDGADRFKALTEAGYNYYRVQNKVNETLGNSYRHSEELIAAQDKIIGAQTKSTERTKDQKSETIELTEANKKQLKSLVKLSDEQLRQNGYTEKQIQSLRELEIQADKLGLSVDDFIDNIDQINGRWLLINSFKNIGEGIIETFKAIGGAWKEVFPPKSLEERSEKLFGMISALHKFSTGVSGLIMDNGKLTETGDKLARTFKGVFAIFDIILTITSGPLKLAFKLVTQLLGVFGLTTLDVTAFIGDAIVKFRDWIDNIWDFTSAFELVVDPIKNGVTEFKEWIKTLKESENLPEDIAKGIVNGFGRAVDFVKNIFKSLREGFTNGFDGLKFGNIDLSGFVDGLKNGVKIAGQVLAELGKIVLEKINGVLTKHGFREISLDVITGFVNGIRDGASNVWNAMIELGKTLIEKIKGVLGIHSPSTVFFAIGGFIIAGLIGGLLAGSSDLKTTFETIGEKCVEFFGNIDFNKLFSVGISAGLVAGLLKIGDAFNKIASPFEAVGDVIEEAADVVKKFQKVVKSFSKVLNSVAMSIKANALKDIALALLMLVGAIAILTFLDIKKVWQAIGVIAMLVTMMGLLIAVLNQSGAKGGVGAIKESLNFAKIGVMLLGIATSLLILTAVLKVLETVDPEKANQTFAAMIIMLGSLAGVIAVFGTLVKGKSAQNISKLGKVFTKLAVALLLMAVVVKILGSTNESELKQGMISIGLFIVTVGLLTAITNIAGKKINQVGSTILKISAAFILMATAVKLLGGMDPDTMYKGGLAIIAFVGIVAGLVAITNLADKGSLDKLSWTLIGMSTAMLLMSATVSILGGMDLASLARGVVATAALAGIIVGLVAATKLASDKELKRIGTTLLMMSFSIGVIGAVVALLGLLDVATLAKGVIAVAALGALMALMIYVTKDAQDVKGNLIVMTVAIAVMAAAVAALSFIDPTSLTGATLALMALIGMFALLVQSTGNASKSMGTLIVMTIAIGLLGGMLYLLADLPIEQTLGAAAALSLLLVAVAGVVTLLGKINISVVNALKGVLALTLMVVPLIAFVGILALMQNVQNATANVNALVVLTTALTLLLIPLTIIGVFAVNAALGVTALLLMAVPLVAFVGILALMENLQNATKNVDLITKLMTTMTGMLAILAIVGPLALIGVGAMASLTALIVAFGLLAVGVGALMDKFPALEDFMNKGLGVLQGLARGLGSLVGEFISGFTDTLPGIGEDLSSFMEKLGPFISGASSIDSSVLAGVGYLSGAIIALTVAEVVNGIASFLSGGSSLSKLGAELSAFMTNAMPFIAGASMLKEETVAGVKALTDMILTLTKANVIEGLTSWFTGGSSLEKFGTQLIPFGEAMVGFSNVVTGIDEEAVVAAANAGKIMAEMAATLPNSGGVIGWFTGENDMSSFADQLVPFGKAVSEFSSVVSGNVDQSSVEAAANAGKTMIAMADTIPNSGGVVGFFTGENDISTFGTQLVIFGRSIVNFSKTVSGQINQEAVEAAAAAGATMVELANTIPNTGGLVAWFTGDNDMATFGTQLTTFGKSIVSFSDSVAGIDPEAMDAAVSAAKSLAAMASELPESGGFMSVFSADNDMSTFGKELAKFGGSMKDFSEEVKGIDTSSFPTLINRFKSLANMAKDISGTDFGGLGNFAKSLKELGKVSIDKFIDSFENADKDIAGAMKDLIKVAVDTIKDNHDKFDDSGKNTMDRFVKGIKSAKATISDAVVSMLSKAITSIRNKYSDFKSAGKYLVDGFAAGISANQYKATAKSRAMAKAAADAARKELDEHSPSKVGYEIGDFYGLGFVNAIGDYADKAYAASSEMAAKAKRGLSETIGKISDFVSSDIDSQPTIRPVLDLSDVRSGTKQINSLFDTRSRVGVLAEVGVVSSMMNSRQNGGNGDVISAIDKLRGDIGKIQPNQYNVNGVTYDDGSNVSEAIKTLIRYTNVDRRS